jgi:hypothetical protein
MKKYLLIILLLLFIKSEISAGPYDFYEQVSGVNTRLNFVYANNNPGGYAWICGNNGVVLKTTNTGTNWIQTGGNGIPVNINLDYIYCIDNYIFTTGVRNDTAYLYRSSNNGSNWTQVFYQKNGYINGLRFKNLWPSGNIGFMFGNPIGGRWSVWKSTNYGVNWDSIGLNIPALPGSQSYSGSVWNGYSDSSFSFGSNKNRIYYTINLGNTWQFLVTPDSINNIVNMSKIFYNSTIGGTTTGLKGLFYTTNGGVNWSKDTAMLGTGKIAGLSLRPLPVDDYIPYTYFYVRNDNKIYHSWNGWNHTIYYTALAGNYTHISNFVQGLTIAIRDNGGISWCSCIISSINKKDNIIPDKFSLHQNYPNPFNPITKIRFEIPEVRGQMTEARLIIFNSLGQEIETIVNQELSPGTYEVSFDGSKYPSGVYFYRLTTGDFTETKRMVLIK